MKGKNKGPVATRATMNRHPATIVREISKKLRSFLRRRVFEPRMIYMTVLWKIYIAGETRNAGMNGRNHDEIYCRSTYPSSNILRLFDRITLRAIRVCRCYSFTAYRSAPIAVHWPYIDIIRRLFFPDSRLSSRALSYRFGCTDASKR